MMSATFRFRAQTTVMVLIAFMLGCNEFIIVGLLSRIGHQFTVSIATVGYLVTTFALVYALSTPIVTLLAGKLSYYQSLLGLMGIFIVGNTYSALAPTFWQLTLSRILTATVAGTIISLVMTFANAIAPVDVRPRLVSWVFSGFSIASVFGVPIGTTLAAAFNWRVAFWAITSVSLLTFVLTTLILPRQIKQTSTSFKQQLTLFTDRRILIGILLPLFNAGAFYVIYTFLQPLFTDKLGVAPDHLGLMLFLYGLTSIFSNQYSGVIASHHGMRAMPRYFAIDAMIFILIPLTLGMHWLGILMLLATGVTMSFMNAPIQIYFLNVAEHEYPQSIVLASSLNSIFFNFGISLGSAIGSQLVAHTGLNFLGYGAAGLILIALFLTRHLNRLSGQTER